MMKRKVKKMIKNEMIRRKWRTYKSQKIKDLCRGNKIYFKAMKVLVEGELYSN